MLSVHSLKLQSVSFASLPPSLFENLELQLCAELSSVRGVVVRHGFSADQTVLAIGHCSGVDVYCISQSQILACLGIYDPNNNFHRILSSEQVTRLPHLF